MSMKTLVDIAKKNKKELAAALAGGAGGVGAYVASQDEDEKKPATPEADFESAVFSAPTMTPPPKRGALPSFPQREAAPERPDIESEIDAMESEGEQQIKSERAEALRRIKAKQAFSKLIDAVALAAAAKQGVVSDIPLSDIDTRLDEQIMTEDTTSSRSRLRDKLRQVRENAQQEYRDKQNAVDKRYSDQINVYRDQLGRIDDQYQTATQEHKAKLDAAKTELQTKIKQANFKKAAAKDINKESNRMGKVVTAAWEDYQNHGDEEQFFKALEINNIPLTDEDKANMLDKGWIWDEVILPDGNWIRKKAIQNFDLKIKNQVMDQQQEDSKVLMEAPNGEQMKVDPSNVDYYIQKGAKVVE